MCKHDIHVEMPVQVWVNMPEFPMEFELKNRHIDACLAPLIYKLNNNQVRTLNCCCGHMQDKRYNLRYEDKTVHAGASVIIDPSSTRHADAMGYYVSFSIANFAEISLENTVEVDGS